MTEEEKNTNQTDEETTNEEKDDFKVVIPQAERTVMPAEEYKDQPTYLQVFANFYIAHFDQDDLEIMNMYDTDSNMIDINDYLLNNIQFTRKTLVKHVLQYHDYNFKALLAEIQKDEDISPENMNDYQDWDTWYEDRRRRIPGSLS